MTHCASTGGDLAQRVAQLEMDLAGKTNAAFVFIKPHACNDKVKDLVREHFTSRGIRVTGEGTLDAETIDKELLIDTHYGAIASKAVKLSPKELNVPDKGKDGFQKLFGLSWEQALASDKVLNAKEACAKMGIDGNAMEAKWAQLDKKTDMIKFGEPRRWCVACGWLVSFRKLSWLVAVGNDRCKWAAKRCEMDDGETAASDGEPAQKKRLLLVRLSVYSSRSTDSGKHGGSRWRLLLRQSGRCFCDQRLLHVDAVRAIVRDSDTEKRRDR